MLEASKFEGGKDRYYTLTGWDITAGVLTCKYHICKARVVAANNVEHEALVSKKR